MFAVLATLTILFLMLGSRAKDDAVTAHETRNAFNIAIHNFRLNSHMLNAYARDHIVAGCTIAQANYWTLINNGDIVTEISWVFDEYGATDTELQLLQNALAIFEGMREKEYRAIGLRAVGEYDDASSLLFSNLGGMSNEYSMSINRFASITNSLHSSIVGRTQIMIDEAEATATAYSSMSVITTVVFAVISVAGTFVLLRIVKVSAIREQKAQEMNSALIASLPMFLEFWNDKGDIVDCSDETLEIFGLKTKQEYVERCYEFQPEFQPCGIGSEEKTRAYVQLALEEDISISEWEHIDKNGDPLPAETVFKRIMVQGNNMVVGYSHDLTAIKAAAKREKEIRDFNNVLLDVAPFGINIWNEVPIVTRTNKHILHLHGLDSEEEYIERFFELSPKLQPCGRNSKELALEYVSYAFQMGSAKFEWLHQTINGELFPAEVTMTRIAWQGRHMLVVYITDLREVKTAMENQYQTERRSKLMIEASPMACLMRDSSLKMIDCNQAAVNLLARRSDIGGISGCGEDCRDCERAKTDSCHAREYLLENSHLIFGGHGGNMVHLNAKIADRASHAMAYNVHRYEEDFVSLNGDIVPCEVTIVPVPYQDDVGFAYYLRDLREERRRQTAEEENRAKTQFLARMSHEIRTPMNAVLGLTEVQLQRNDLEADIEEAFTRIHGSSNILLSIINDILDLSRVDAGKLEIIPAMYEIINVIMDAVHLNLPYIGNKNLELRLEIAEDLPVFMYGDELRIKQIVSNILSNALKYTQEGLVTLSMDMEDRCDNEGTLVICVRDTGMGMTEEEMKNLFGTEFKRFNIEANRGIQGTGLGMSITFNLVSQMGGKISVESKPGVGSLFTVYIPQKIEGEQRLGEVAVASLRNMEFAQLSKNRMIKQQREPMPYGRVLAVDDVETNLYVLEGMLAPYGIKVDSVTSGQKAIDKISDSNVYDIIFMDHMMPMMDGIQTTKFIRSMGYEHPIIALTANAVKGVREVFNNSGFDGYISKPINLSRLNSYLERFIKNKQPPEIIEAARAMMEANGEQFAPASHKIDLMEVFVRDAQKTIAALENILEKSILDDNDFISYTITVHAMVSALANIEHKDLADAASSLEVAGRIKDFKQIMFQTPQFVANLRQIVDSHIKEELTDEEGQDTAFLREQFLHIKNACEMLDIETAEHAINSILSNPSSRIIKTKAKDINAQLLRGDFDEATILAQTAVDDFV